MKKAIKNTGVGYKYTLELEKIFKLLDKLDISHQIYLRSRDKDRIIDHLKYELKELKEFTQTQNLRQNVILDELIANENFLRKRNLFQRIFNLTS